MIFIEYPKCSTCQKAKKWLSEHNIDYVDRHIKEENPTADELKAWVKASGMLYKSLNLKEKLPTMTDEEKIDLLATDGMLVKRPLIIDGDTVLIGFREAEWKKHFDIE